MHLCFHAMTCPLLVIHIFVLHPALSTPCTHFCYACIPSQNAPSPDDWMHLLDTVILPHLHNMLPVPRSITGSCAIPIWIPWPRRPHMLVLSHSYFRHVVPPLLSSERPPRSTSPACYCWWLPSISACCTSWIPTRYCKQVDSWGHLQGRWHLRAITSWLPSPSWQPLGFWGFRV